MKELEEASKRVAGLIEESFPEALMGESGEKLGMFVREHVLWGERMHLVARGSMEESLGRQVVDSLHMLEFARRNGCNWPGGRVPGEAVTVGDVGAGYGFPGMVWKIVEPNMEITLFERKEKPAIFLRQLISRLNISGVRLAGEAAEGKDERFAVVVSKAAGRLSTMLPVAERLLKEKGIYITIKERDWEWELEKSSQDGLELKLSEELPGGRGFLVAFQRGAGQREERRRFT